MTGEVRPTKPVDLRENSGICYSQKTLKLVSLLFVMVRSGLEPPTHGFSVRSCNDVTTDTTSTSKNSQIDYAKTLAKTLQEHPELCQITEAWSELSDEIRQLIIEIVRHAADV